MKKSGRVADRVSAAERVISALILCALAALVVWIVRRGISEPEPFADPTAFESRSVPSDAAQSAMSAGDRSLQIYAPSGYEAIGETEVFSAETAYEKIDGKVEFYLPLGLRSLHCQRFATSARPGENFEMFLYELSGADASFSAWTRQRREDAQVANVGGGAYVVGNALFLAHGPFYVEFIGSSDSESLRLALLECARRFVQLKPVETALPREVTWFPEEGLFRESVALTLENGLGFEGFSRLFSAVYSVSNQEVRAFIVPFATPAQAVQATSSYGEYLVDNGAVFCGDLPNISGGNVYNVFGAFEVIFAVDAVVGGVHEAPDEETAMWVAQQLHRALRERQKSSAP